MNGFVKKKDHAVFDRLMQESIEATSEDKVTDISDKMMKEIEALMIPDIRDGLKEMMGGASNIAIVRQYCSIDPSFKKILTKKFGISYLLRPGVVNAQK
jgi:hypothetical protein